MDWKSILNEELAQPYFKEIRKSLVEAYKTQKCEPNAQYIFRAFDECPYEDVKVVILGQDPYPSDATGVAFGYDGKGKLPLTLQNIFKDVAIEYGSLPQDATLLSWARQGVFLLNAYLSTIHGYSKVHTWWGPFTDNIIRRLNQRENPIVFVFWGREAQEKMSLVESPHRVQFSAHPSPRSAHFGFYNNGHFKRINQFLSEFGYPEIDWLGRRTGK